MRISWETNENSHEKLMKAPNSHEKTFQFSREKWNLMRISWDLVKSWWDSHENCCHFSFSHEIFMRFSWELMRIFVREATISRLHSVRSGKGNSVLQYSPDIHYPITISKLHFARSRKATQRHNIHLFLRMFAIPPHLVAVFCPQREKQPSSAAFSRHPHSSHCLITVICPQHVK